MNLDEEKLNSVLSGLPFTLNDKQYKFIVAFINSNGNWILNGIAGSGKSTIMLVLKKYYGDEIVFFASSGVANLSLPEQIGNGTGHSGLSLSTKPATEIDYKKVSRKCTEIFGSSDLVKIIVIDEFYGYNSDNLDLIHRRIQRFNKKSGKRKRRNIRLLGVGDPAQQITICDEDLQEEYAKRWGHHLMFKSDVWERFDFTYAVLDKVERQKDPIFKACLDVIRYNQEDRFERCLAWINKRVNTRYPSDRLVLAATNKTVDVINNKVLARNHNKKHTFYAKIDGNFNMRDVLVKDKVTLCKDLKVMLINNDQEGRWVNGSIGVITDVVDGLGVDVQLSTGETHFVEEYTWENKDTYVEPAVLQDDGSIKDELRQKVVGALKTLPLVQASSYSIAKSQGLTITEPFVIDFEDTGLYTSPKLLSFGTNFVYVALSRALSSDLITLARRIDYKHIKPCLDSLNYWFYTTERSII
ncbi:helicase [Vibrio phage 11895-B1]|uniref:helicase n=1 Tax=Vibrio phage 11895-B1 TaxID=754075 RepID=UPI0002C0C684|nr:helicase [Vibrio phage 11895-B1]AGH32234.1 AAA ATPase [Vibrio phage 11895-B1]